MKNKNNEDIPVYSVSNSLGFCKDYFGKEVASKNKTTYKIVPRGCFAYNPSRINVGSVDWQNEEERVIVSPLYNVFSVSPLLDQQYLLYYLKSNVTLSRIRAVASGSVRDNLKLSMLYEFPIDLISLDKQYDVVSTLNAVQKIIDLYQKGLSCLDELVRARFVEMFGDPRINPMNFHKSRLKDTCDIITGNTPSRKNQEYYGNYIEWIKTDNIVTNKLNPTYAKENLSKEGMDVGRIVDKNCILMACIAGSISSIGKVCVTDRKVAFNQQINAIVPKKYNCMFLYVLLQVSKEYLVDGINMALKGILSKSRLEEKQFIVPPLELQKQFASFVQEIDKSRLRELLAIKQIKLLLHDSWFLFY